MLLRVSCRLRVGQKLTFTNVQFRRIVLKKSFLADEPDFSGPLMRFARGDVRDHNVLHKNDHGRSYRP
jgi:hypothetical protein